MALDIADSRLSTTILPTFPVRALAPAGGDTSLLQETGFHLDLSPSRLPIYLYLPISAPPPPGGLAGEPALMSCDDSRVPSYPPGQRASAHSPAAPAKVAVSAKLRPAT